MYWERSRTTFSEMGSSEPPPGWKRMGTCEPSVWSLSAPQPRFGSLVG
jgi:hypothetical protein